MHGHGVGRGITAGRALLMPAALEPATDAPHFGDARAESERAEAALAGVAADLTALAERATGDASDILRAAALMAEDPALAEGIRRLIVAGASAEFAVQQTVAEVAAIFAAAGGATAERAADLRDLAQRTIARLRGVPAPAVPHSSEPFVLIARDLAPADTALLDPAMVLAIATEEGGPTSHTAILARAMALPAVVGIPGLLGAIRDGQHVIVDAQAGRIEIGPSEDSLRAAVVERARREAEASAPVTPGALADGTPVQLLTNVGGAEEAAAALQLGAEGVGLFRTELLFLDATTPPSVAWQTEQYTAMLRAFEGKRVVVRVLDAGADKPLAFLHNAAEENPALGLRGIRALRANEQILRDQLRALAAAGAATAAELSVMAPMITDAEEAAWFARLSREHGLTSVGVMIEVPSAALLAESIMREVDFVSIGTNDLTQHTLAADRSLGAVAHFQNPWHPAVLRLVKMLGDAGLVSGTPVGVCGEAAADPALAAVLVGLGVTSLSMSAAALAEVRAELLMVTLDEARERAARVLLTASAAEARSAAVG